MRRWNGWGDDSIDYPLPETAAGFLHELVGPGSPPPEIALAQAVASVPASRLIENALFSRDPLERLRHARGQSLPDWVALRTGRISIFPDGVAHPLTSEDVRALLKYAAANGVHLIPYGGGTSVAGHINPAAVDAPILTVNMQRLNRLQRLDESSQLAVFGAGIQGPDLEAQLRASGYTMGHFPQSFEYSTLGGWIATRSSGQQSLGYGRIEDLFAGGRMESPTGSLHIPPFPASAAGPDLRHLVLGSEGRFGIITDATVRVRRLPEKEEFHAVFFPDFASGMAAVQAMIQQEIPLSMLRLSTSVETTTTLALAGHERLIGTLERLLSVRGIDSGKCLLLLGFTGKKGMVRIDRRLSLDLAKQFGGIHVGRTFGSQWKKGRFRTPYLRNTLWEAGYAVDTVETATDWANIPTMISAVESALSASLGRMNERAHVFTHLSHVYRDGASVYTTYLFRLADDPDETLARWQAMKASVSRAIVANHGTISHQHGVGVDHAQYLEAEKGKMGMDVIEALCQRFDPAGMMNPGKLIPQQRHAA